MVLSTAFTDACSRGRLNIAARNSSLERKPLSLNEFLKDQEQSAFVATIEELKDRPGEVKLTPWREVAGCLCHAALEVPRDSIESVKPTDNTHYCCGKVLRVGEIRFKKGAKIEIEKVFTQVMQSAGSAAPSGGAQLPFGMGLLRS